MKYFNIKKLKIKFLTQTCRIPYLSSMSRKLYSLAWAGLGKVPGGGLTCDAPVVGGPGTTAIPPDSYV